MLFEGWIKFSFHISRKTISSCKIQVLVGQRTPINRTSLTLNANSLIPFYNFGISYSIAVDTYVILVLF